MIVNHQKLTKVVEAICVAAGAGAEEASMTAGHLVEANLKGHDSHGVGMIPIYVNNLKTVSYTHLTLPTSDLV